MTTEAATASCQPSLGLRQRRRMGHFPANLVDQILFLFPTQNPYSQPIIFQVSEAIRSSFNKFHFTMKPLNHSIAPIVAKHSSNGVQPAHQASTYSCIGWKGLALSISILLSKSRISFLYAGGLLLLFLNNSASCCISNKSDGRFYFLRFHNKRSWSCQARC